MSKTNPELIIEQVEEYFVELFADVVVEMFTPDTAMFGFVVDEDDVVSRTDGDECDITVFMEAVKHRDRGHGRNEYKFTIRDTNGNRLKEPEYLGDFDREDYWPNPPK